MIIKSLSRKTPNFKQLSNYIINGADKNYIYARNIYANPEDLKTINNEFAHNYNFLKKQKNSNSIYHEILSLSKSDIDIKLQKEALYNIADEYVKVRAKNCLVFGGIHEANNNIHFHLMFSSNEIEKQKNHYVSKKEFEDIKKGLEKYVLKEYPQLNQEIIFNKDRKNQKKISQKEYEYKKRTGKKTQKEIVIDELKEVFNSSKTKEDFFNNLFSKNLEIYTRGNIIGFLNLETGGKHRLKTLGLENDFNSMNSLFKKQPGVEEPKTSLGDQKQPSPKEKSKPHQTTKPPPKEKQDYRSPGEKVRKKVNEKVKRSAEQKRETPRKQYKPPPKENKKSSPAGEQKQQTKTKQQYRSPREKPQKKTHDKIKKPAEQKKELSPAEKEIEAIKKLRKRMNKNRVREKGFDRDRTR